MSAISLSATPMGASPTLAPVAPASPAPGPWGRPAGTATAFARTATTSTLPLDGIRSAVAARQSLHDPSAVGQPLFDAGQSQRTGEAISTMIKTMRDMVRKQREEAERIQRETGLGVDTSQLMTVLRLLEETEALNEYLQCLWTDTPVSPALAKKLKAMGYPGDVEYFMQTREERIWGPGGRKRAEELSSA